MRFVLGISCLLLLNVSFAQTPAPPMTLAEQESFLAKAEITKIRPAKGGITGSRKATLILGGITHDAHIQIIDEAKTRFEGAGGTELNFRDTYKFNIAGYRLNKMLDLRMSPPCVERNVEGNSASLCWWVDNVLMEEGERMKKKITPPDNDSWNNQMYIVRVFDQLIYNQDRNVGNLLITKDWKLWMIDHTRAFRMHTTLKTPKDLVRCDRDLLAALKRLDEASLKQEMESYLTGLEIKGLLARRDKIVAFFEKAPPSRIYVSERRQ